MHKSLGILLPQMAAIFMLVFCVNVKAQQQAAEERINDPKTGAISGKVGDESGQPIPNTSVYVRSISGLQIRNATTANDGSFKVSGLDSTFYQVSASAPTYVTRPRDPDSPFAYYRPGDSVSVELNKGGVVTGTVISSSGDPVVAVRVRAYMVRDAKGQPPRPFSNFGERTTDDRGIYRIYGLAAGTYLVAAGGGSPGFSFGNVSPYDSDAPTFAPSSNRETAAEFIVRSGEDTSSADIRYRGEAGHWVTGIAKGPIAPGGFSSFTITLTPVSVAMSLGGFSTFQRPGSHAFAFSGVTDGTYELVAQSAISPTELAVSETRRIVVSGGDITGLELATKLLGSVSGHVVLEASKLAECAGKLRPLFSETLVVSQRNEEKSNRNEPQLLRFFGAPVSPDNEGAFTIRNLAPAQYSFNARFFAKYWYVQTITLEDGKTAKAASGNQPIDLARTWITLKPGERLKGLTIKLAEGAASIRGQINTGKDETFPQNLFVYLVPAEPESAEEVSRFFAVEVGADRTFGFNNLAPGRYWAIPRQVTDKEPALFKQLRMPGKAEMRANLRREADAVKTEIDLKPCQNLTDFQLQFGLPSSLPAKRTIANPSPAGATTKGISSD